MADTHGISLSKIELLTGSNYFIWEMKVSAILRSRKLYKQVIEEPEPEQGEPDSAEAKIRETWEAKNDEAFGIIVVTLSSEQAGLFIGARKAKVVWDELKRIHAGNIEDRRIDTALELKNIKMIGNDTVDSYINRARNISTRSAALGHVIPDREIVYHVVRGLPNHMESVATVLRPQRAISLEQVQQTLKEEEERQRSKNGGYSGNPFKLEKAYKAKEGRGVFPNSKPDRKCFVCNRSGHIAKDCWYRTDPQEMRSKGGSNRGRWNQNNKRGGRGREQASVAKSDKNEQALNTQSKPGYTIRDIAKENGKIFQEWNLDSGCTSHMTPRLDWMEKVTPIQNEISVAEKGRIIQAEAKGDIRLSTIVDNEVVNVCLKDVLYVPKLRANLLSVSSIISKDNEIVFCKEGAKVQNNIGEVIAEAKEKNKMFVLETITRDIDNVKGDGNCLVAQPDIQSDPSQTIVPTTPMKDTGKLVEVTQKNLWHKRLGHLNEEYIDRLKKHEMVRGLKFGSEKLDLCEPCVLGKMAQSPFKKIENDNSTKPLELIHMDLCGPMPTKSLGGARYMYVLVDSYSRRMFVKFLKTKNEAFECFVEFKNRRENELGCKIKNVRSDNGTEFVNSNFEELFRNEGINHQKTVPYTPQSNGVAERANRSLLDKARTMLIDSELPFEFWAETVATAAYLKNYTPTKGKNVTPLEKWNERKPTVSHLKVFGSIVYYHIPKNHRNKLQPRSKKGIFIGYSQSRVAYRIYDPTDGSIHEVRTARFNEAEKGAQLLKENNFSTERVDMLDYLNENCSSETEQEENLIPGEGIQYPTEPDPEQGNDDLILHEQPERERQRPGRKPGITMQMLQDRHLIETLEREERLVTEGARRSERLKAKHQASVTMENECNTPKSYQDAMASPNSKEWENAMKDEITSLQIHKVWNIVPKTQGMKVIQSKWIFTTKENLDGTIDKRKARLVAVGCNQTPGVDYQESFSPVMKLESLRTLIALASQLNLKIKQYDVKTAYLYGHLTEKVFMQQPQGFAEKGKEENVCELQKSLYGLPQSGRCWNEKLNETLIEIGLKRLESDPCTYIMKTTVEVIIMGVYVDDMIIFGTNEIIIDKVMDEVKRHFEITEKKGIVDFLGIELKETTDGFELSQRKYVHKILKKFGLAECNVMKTPGDPNQNLNEHQDSPPIEQKKYLEMIGSLMYLSVGTRPDISYSVSQLSQFSKNPKEIHMKAIKRVYRYLKGTSDYTLRYDREARQLEASTDASWCCTQDAKSFSGCTVKLGNALVNWKSRKQNLVALSTCESELMAICEGVKELKWMTSFLTELPVGECVKLPLTLKTDSKAAIDWIKGSSLHSRTKHINRKYFFVRDEVTKGNILPCFVRSEEMEADFLTKNLSLEKLSNCINSCGMFTDRE